MSWVVVVNIGNVALSNCKISSGILTYVGRWLIYVGIEPNVSSIGLSISFKMINTG